ncbi:unnamed protein product [Alternaria alternata]
MCDDFIEEYGDNAAIPRSIMPCLQNANALLLLALGSCKSISDGTERPGMAYYSYAKDILACKREEMSFALAQTMTLAALYTNHGIEDCSRFVSSDLVSITGSDVLSVESLEEGPETAYAMRVQLRKILEKAQTLPTDVATARCQVEIPKKWRPVLPSWLNWKDEELPSTDPLKASLRAEYYSGIVKSLWPHLEIVINYKCFPLTMDKLSADQQELTEAVYLWVKAALASITAFDRVGAVADSTYEAYQRPSISPVLLSNPVKTLHAQVASLSTRYFPN